MLGIAQRGDAHALENTHMALVGRAVLLDVVVMDQRKDRPGVVGLDPLVGIVLAYPVVPALRRLVLRTLGPTLLTLGEWIIATALAVFSILFLTGNSYNPFLYFRF